MCKEFISNKQEFEMLTLWFGNSRAVQGGKGVPPPRRMG